MTVLPSAIGYAAVAPGHFRATRLELRKHPVPDPRPTRFGTRQEAGYGVQYEGRKRDMKKERPTHEWRCGVAVRTLLPALAAVLTGCPPYVFPLRPQRDLVAPPDVVATPRNGEVELRAAGLAVRIPRMNLGPGGLDVTLQFVDRRETLRLVPRQTYVTTQSGRRLELCGVEYPAPAGDRLTATGSPALLTASYDIAPDVPWVRLTFDAAGRYAPEQPAARPPDDADLLGAPVTLHLDGLEVGDRRVRFEYPFRLDCEALRQRYRWSWFHPPVRAALRHCDS